ncbi:hypothetical protein BGZ76_000469 [Entomortierella beljakovae]|nr:hypothetical protein BGZ76_000469 [Entomortierella beljakovae]
MGVKVGNRVAIVTGANTGVGYAIVQRLVKESPFPLTVILACRNKIRAQEALQSLQKYFDNLQEKHQKSNKDHHEVNTYHHPELKIELVDVGSVASVLAFNQRIKDQFSKIDYLFCNAGVLPSEGLMWSKVFLDMFRAPMDLVIRSDVLIQPKQHLTEDGIGNVLACNVFGHYMMIKGLEDQLNKTEDDPGRVIWTSSLTGEKHCFKIEDWQGLEAEQPYESSKWVTDLLAIRLNEIWAGSENKIATGTSSGSESTNNTEESTPTRRVTRSSSKTSLTNNNKKSSQPTLKKKNIISITTHPGVVASGIGGLAAWIVMLRIALHYVLRLCGERNQNITGYHGANSNVFVALKQPAEKLDHRSKYGSRIKNFGAEYLDVEKVDEYEESQATIVVDELEKLRLSFVSS